MSHNRLIHGRNYGSGKRKNAVARVFLKPGQGTIQINGRTIEDYFPREVLRMVIAQPFDVVAQAGQLDVDVNVAGGGISAQAQAIRHGISWALVGMDFGLKPALKKAGFLTRDARKRERKKPGQPGARKKFQYSKR
jgi:small subunit ribosomal protein S9